MIKIQYHPTYRNKNNEVSEDCYVLYEDGRPLIIYDDEDEAIAVRDVMVAAQSKET